MRKTFGTMVLILALVLMLGAAPVLAAAPNENASHVAVCAVTMGGQHVANCAQTMELGVSSCATMP